MIKLNNSQIKGIIILVLSVVATLLLKEDSIFQLLAGILCAVGLSYILKFIPVRFQDMNLKPRKIFRK